MGIVLLAAAILNLPTEGEPRLPLLPLKSENGLEVPPCQVPFHCQDYSMRRVFGSGR